MSEKINQELTLKEAFENINKARAVAEDAKNRILKNFSELHLAKKLYGKERIINLLSRAVVQNAKVLKADLRIFSDNDKEYSRSSDWDIVSYVEISNEAYSLNIKLSYDNLWDSENIIYIFDLFKMEVALKTGKYEGLPVIRSYGYYEYQNQSHTYCSKKPFEDYSKKGWKNLFLAVNEPERKIVR